MDQSGRRAAVLTAIALALALGACTGGSPDGEVPPDLADPAPEGPAPGEPWTAELLAGPVDEPVEHVAAAHGDLLAGNAAEGAVGARQATLWQVDGDDVTLRWEAGGDVPSAATSVARSDGVIAVGGVVYPPGGTAEARLWAGSAVAGLEEVVLSAAGSAVEAIAAGPPGWIAVMATGGTRGTGDTPRPGGVVLAGADPGVLLPVELPAGAGEEAVPLAAAIGSRDGLVVGVVRRGGERRAAAWTMPLAGDATGQATRVGEEELAGAVGVDLVGVTAWEGGYVVVGQGAAGLTSQLWRVDARGSWERRRAEGGPFSAPLGRPGSLIADGRGLLLSAGGAWTVWRSGDGSAWEEVGPDKPEGWLLPTAPAVLGGGPPGLLAAGRAGAVAAWRADDDRWERLRGFEHEQPRQVETSPAGLAAAGEGVVAVAARNQSADVPDSGPTAWRRDAAGTWDPIEAPAGEGAAVVRLGAARDAVWAVGSITGEAGRTATAWRLDGRTFISRPDLTADGTSVAVGVAEAGGVVLVALTSVDVEGVSRVGVVRDGDGTWAHVPGPYDTTDDALAADLCHLPDGGFIVVGTRIDADGTPGPATWSREPDGTWAVAERGAFGVPDQVAGEVTACVGGAAEVVLLGTVGDEVRTWRSADGRRWRADAIVDDGVPSVLAAGPEGAVLLGLDPLRRELRAWMYADRSWHPVASRGPAVGAALVPGPAVVTDDGSLVSTATLGDRFLAFSLPPVEAER